MPLRSAHSSAPAQRIVAAARAHFFMHGSRAVTMDDLAAALGVSKKTLYARFAGKEELLRAVLESKFREVDADLGRITAQRSADFAQSLQQLLVCMQHHTSELQPPFVRDMGREPEFFRLVQMRRAEIIQRHFGKLFSRWRRAGLVRKDIPVHLMIEILLGAVQVIVNPPKLAELGLEPRTAAPAILKVILEGIITPTGRSKL